MLWSDSKSGAVRKKAEFQFEQVFRNISPWSPDSPTLYTLQVVIETESTRHVKTHRFGFRQIETRGAQILLNGEPILIKGMSRHEQYPGLGNAVPERITRMDIQHIKELGCNFLRTCHYSQHPHLYELCDEYGLLVWDEIPAWKTSLASLSSDSVWQADGAPQLRELVEQNRNRTCVVMWSVGNEFNSDKPSVGAFVQRAADHVRSLDSTRLVTFASDKHRPGATDLGFQHVDVVAVNEYYGWYYGAIHDVDDMLRRLHQAHPDKPILVSEVGCGTMPGLHAPNPPSSGQIYSEEYQVRFLQTHLQQIYAPEHAEYVAGAILWVYADFKDPHRYSNAHPAAALYQNSKGLVTQERKPKPGFEVVKRFFAIH